MDHSALHHLIGLSIILLTRLPTYATPVILNDSLEGSGQLDSGSTDLTPIPTISFFNESVKSTSIDGEKHSKSFLDQLVEFLQENHLPIIVITTLLFLIITILCSAAILSHRRKVSTYYPCAFPPKMYVDEQDKTGGARFFSEVPEKANTSSSSSEEPVNSARKLQEDIMLATKNLRTPIKTPWREKNEVAEDQKHAKDEGTAQCDKSQEESCGSLEDKTTNQSAVEDTLEKSCPSRSQDSITTCDMEKTDPLDSGPPEESKHSSGPEKSEIQEDMNKQDVATSGSPFISEEKTAF
ncbi:transmembrane protein 119-like [Carassius carassius]|uniref:transmembrane protein 119-like n=1 Tax=Carassius carassius TaxID=217509 RepID=UPI002869081E|nr:transmembrane protein 119-like [Carassius carassius]